MGKEKSIGICQGIKTSDSNKCCEESCKEMYRFSTRRLCVIVIAHKSTAGLGNPRQFALWIQGYRQLELGDPYGDERRLRANA